MRRIESRRAFVPALSTSSISSTLFTLLLLTLVLAPVRGEAFSHAEVESYVFSVFPQVRASSPMGPVDDLLGVTTETPGSFLPASAFMDEGIVPGSPPFRSWSADILLKQVGQVSTGTSNASGETHRFELDDIRFEMSGTEFFRSPLDNSTLPDWTVPATYHFVGTYYFGATAMPFDVSGTAMATADHTNTSTVKQVRYLGAIVVPLPTFSSGGVNYTPRIGLSSTVTVVPEPSSAMLIGLGLLALAIHRRAD